MTDAFAPPGFDAVAVAGAVGTMEEALQAHQMRFILAWSLHLKQVARPAQVAHRAGPRMPMPPM
jgi:hypothetical protein